MYFMDAVRLLMRRWYVALIGLVLIAGGATYAATSVPTQYQASGEMLFLLPPASTGPTTPSNPYINLVPGLTTTASLIATEAMTKDVSAELVKRGFTSEYSVALVPATGPLLTISTTDTDPHKAVKMRDEVMQWLRDRLDKRQKAVSVPASQFIYTEDTNVGKGPEVLPGNKIRAMAGVGGAGMILTLLAAFVLDRLLSRRRKVADLKLASVEDGDEDGKQSAPTRKNGTAAKSATPAKTRLPAKARGRANGRPNVNGTQNANGRPAANGSQNGKPTEAANPTEHGENARVKSTRRGT